MPILRIAIVCFSPSWGGLELMLTKLAHALSNRGHRVTLVSPHDSGIARECQRRGLLHFPVQPRLKYLDLFAASTLSALLRSENIDTLIAGQSGDLSTCLLARHKYPAARLVFLQQMYFGHRKKDLFHRWVYGNVDLWITLTDAMKLSVLHNTVVQQDRVHTISFGVDVDEFNPATIDKRRARILFNLPQDRFIAAVVGRYDKGKGQEFLIEAAPHILRQHPNTHFLFVGQETHGEHGYLDTLRHMIAARSLNDACQFLPFTQEMPRLLAAIDVLVLPTRFETYGYILLEAMAMGKPVLATRAGGVPEIVRDGETGLLFQPADSRDLTEKLLMLLNNPELYAALSRNARPWITDHFNFRHNVDDLVRHLKNLHNLQE